MSTSQERPRRYAITEMPPERMVRVIVHGLINPPPRVVFLWKEGRFVEIRNVPDSELPQLSEQPNEGILEAFLNGEALFNHDTGKFELKR